jgi:hypothetical protein
MWFQILHRFVRSAAAIHNASAIFISSSMIETNKKPGALHAWFLRSIFTVGLLASALVQQHQT